jgi:hypothetical protein
VRAASLGRATLAQCHRFLVIPTRHCANLSPAVYTVLSDRHTKRVHDGLELPHSTAGDFDEPDHMADAVGVTWPGYVVAYGANRLRRWCRRSRPATARLRPPPPSVGLASANSRDPHVVDGPWSSTLDGCCGQSAPVGGYCLVAGQYRNVGQPASEFLAATLAPVADLRPPGQLCEGNESDQRLAADQACSKRPGERAPMQQRGDIGVQDGWVHG